MKKTRFCARDFLSTEQRMKRTALRSRRASDRLCHIDARLMRGVLTPVLRGCSEPRWLRDA